MTRSAGLTTLWRFRWRHPATHPVALCSGDIGLQLAFKTPQASTVEDAANSTTPATDNDG
jgi:hypothetical protein